MSITRAPRLTKKELCHQVAKRTNCNEIVVRQIITAYCEVIFECLANGFSVALDKPLGKIDLLMKHPRIIPFSNYMCDQKKNHEKELELFSENSNTRLLLGHYDIVFNPTSALKDIVKEKSKEWYYVFYPKMPKTMKEYEVYARRKEAEKMRKQGIKGLERENERKRHVGKQ